MKVITKPTPPTPPGLDIAQLKLALKNVPAGHVVDRLELTKDELVEVLQRANDPKTGRKYRINQEGLAKELGVEILVVGLKGGPPPTPATPANPAGGGHGAP